MKLLLTKLCEDIGRSKSNIVKACGRSSYIFGRFTAYKEIRSNEYRRDFFSFLCSTHDDGKYHDLSHILFQTPNTNSFNTNRILQAESFQTIAQSATIDQTASLGQFVKVGANARIGEFSNIDSFASIGEYAKIGRNVRVNQFSNIGANAEIGDGCALDQHSTVGSGARIATNAYIGTFCMVQSNAVVQERAVIHKFVEVPSGQTIPRNQVLIQQPSSYEIYQNCAFAEQVNQQE